MSRFIDAGKGTLNKSDNRKSDKSPEYFGQLEIDGTEYRLAGWVKENPKTGRKFFSLAVSLKQDDSEQPDNPPQAKNEDIPF